MALSSSHCGSKYDVFVSFGGDEIRETFFSHLHSALEKQKFKVFKDSEIEKGEKISSQIYDAIECSRIALIIFSETYVSSCWCLNELVQIMKCKDNGKQKVIPIFYRVNPKVVREPKISHEDECENREKIQAWRDALREASGITGWDSRNTSPDAALVEEIVKDVANKLKQENPGGEPKITHEDECENREKIQARRDALREASGITGRDSRNTRSDAALVEEIVKDLANKLKQENPVLRGSQKQASSVLTLRWLCGIQFILKVFFCRIEEN